MRMRKKKLLACILAAVMALPGTGMTAWAREEPKPSVELYRNGELLEDGDIIGENDLLYWKTAVDLSDEKELIELPEKLVYAGEKRITMEMPNGFEKEVKAEGFEDFSVIIDNPLYEKKETEAGTGNEPKATPSDGTKVAELSISPRERVMVSSSSKPS
ncbi:MAG: hypothetical protein LIP16_18150, partial [Clostridium sp.]|nr:hypothetical protein [Clostridium sp.]